jgi:hypothetical protein
MVRTISALSPGEAMRREVTKFLFAIVPWLLLVASGYALAFGFSRVARKVVAGIATFEDFLDLFAAVDTALAYVGTIGALTAIGFFAARSQLKAQMKRIRDLERELDKASGESISSNRHAENIGHGE